MKFLSRFFALLFSTVISLRSCLSRCSFEILKDNRVIEDISEYRKKLSHVETTDSFLFDIESPVEYLKAFPAIDYSFRFCSYTEFPESYDYVFFSCLFEQNTFETALSHLKSQKGYDDYYVWVYKTYKFALNRTLQVLEAKDPPDLSICNIVKWIYWAQFAAYSEEKHSICFLGFYYYYGEYDEEHNLPAFQFSNWDEFFGRFFNFYDWD